MKKNHYSAGTFFLKIVLAFLIVSSTVSFAQINVGGQPMSTLMELNSNFEMVTMPEVDSRTLLE